MPSDARLDAARGVLAVPIERHRSAIATALDEMHAALAANRAGRDGRASQLRHELGAFAASHIDAGRLASILGEEATLDPDGVRHLDRAHETLRAVAAKGDDLFAVDVGPMEDVASAVGARLADAGRAFAAIRMAAAILGQHAAPEKDLERALAGFPFARWNAAERRLAPPLIVSVAGIDLRVGGLADVLDGGLKIVILVEGDCAPAPLARLITPQTLVVQTEDAAGLEPLALWPGPAVAALVPPSAARFVHHPAHGAETWQRLVVQFVPAAPTRSVGGLSPAQQAEDLRQLAALASSPVVREPSPATVAPLPAADPVDRIAAWLLHQADLTAPR